MQCFHEIYIFGLCNGKPSGDAFHVYRGGSDIKMEIVSEQMAVRIWSS